MLFEAFEFFLSLATFFVRNSSYHPGVYEVPSWLGVLEGPLGRRKLASEECFEILETSSYDSLRTDRGFSYNSRVLAARNYLQDSARRPATVNPDLKFGRGEWE
jgi:hypothetical protein